MNCLANLSSYTIFICSSMLFTTSLATIIPSGVFKLLYADVISDFLIAFLEANEFFLSSNIFFVSLISSFKEKSATLSGFVKISNNSLDAFLIILTCHSFIMSLAHCNFALSDFILFISILFVAIVLRERINLYI